MATGMADRVRGFDWTADLTARLTGLVYAGLTTEEIAVRLGATVNQVRYKRQRLGLCGSYWTQYRNAARGESRSGPLCRRSPRRAYSRPYIRVVLPGLVQARPHYGGGKLYRSVNLGTYNAKHYGHSEERAAAAAGKAAIEFLKRCAGPPPRQPWDVIRELQRVEFDGRPLVNPALLPKWVRRRRDGRFDAKNCKGAGGVHLPGPFETPEEAHRAMAARLGRPCWV